MNDMALITCTKCGETKPKREFAADKRKRNGRQSHCRACDRKRIREIYRKKRVALLNKLGGPICNRCGFSDIRALQIDHIHGGGFQEYKASGNRTVYARLYKLTSEELKKDYQVLCANCNCIKRIENREHGNLISPATDDLSKLL